MNFFQKNPLSILQICLIITIVILTFSFFLTAPKNYSFGEFSTFWIYNNRVSLYTIIHFGQLGLWDNYNGIGIPAIVDFNSIFYPITLLGFFIHDELSSIYFQVLFHLCAAGIVFYFVLRTFKCSKFSAIAGSCIFLLNYYVIYILEQGFMGEVYNLVFMPLAFLFFWKSLFQNNYKFAILSGICLAMEIISMSVYPIYFIQLLILLLVIYYFFYSIIFGKKNILKLVKQIFITLLLFYIITIGLSAIKLLPVLEYKNLSVRNSVPLYGSAVSHWDPINWDNFFKYIPPIPMTDYKLKIFDIFNYFFLFLILIAFTKKSKEVYFFFIVSIVSIWAAFANNALFDLQKLFYYIIPGLNTNEMPIRFLIIEHFTTVVLAGIGLYQFELGIIKINKLYKRKFIQIIPKVLFIFIVFYLVMYVKTDFLLYISDQSTVLLKPSGQNDFFNRKIAEIVHNTPEPVHTASFYGTAWSKRVNFVNAFTHGFMLVNHPNPGYATTYQWINFQDTKEYKNQGYIRKKYKLLSLYNTKYLITEKMYDDYPNKYITPLLFHTNGIHVYTTYPNDDSGTIYQINSYMPFIAEADNAILLTGKNDFNDFHAFSAKTLFLDKFLNTQNTVVFSDRRTKISEYSKKEIESFAYIIIEGNINKSDNILNNKQVHLEFNRNDYLDMRLRSLSIMNDKPAKWLSKKSTNTFKNILSKLQSSDQKSKISLQRLTPEYIKFDVSLKKNRTFITIANAYYPGWNAYIDGKKVPLYMANGLRQGLVINREGNHLVELKFQPLSFYFGTIISIITLLLIILYFVITLNKKRVYNKVL